jgi:hypothetical protein
MRIKIITGELVAMPLEQIEQDLKKYIENFIPDYFRTYSTIGRLTYNKKNSAGRNLITWKKIFQQLHVASLFVVSMLDNSSVAPFLARNSEFQINFLLTREIIKLRAVITNSRKSLAFLNTDENFYVQQIVTHYINMSYLTEDLDKIFYCDDNSIMQVEEEKLKSFLEKINVFMIQIKNALMMLDREILHIDTYSIMQDSQLSDHYAAYFYDEFIEAHQLKCHLNIRYYDEKVRALGDRPHAEIKGPLIDAFNELLLGQLKVYKYLQENFREQDYLDPLECLRPDILKVLDESDEEQKEIIDKYFDIQLLHEKEMKLTKMSEEDAHKETRYMFYDVKYSIDCIRHILQSLHKDESVYQDFIGEKIIETERLLLIGIQLGIKGDLSALSLKRTDSQSSSSWGSSSEDSPAPMSPSDEKSKTAELYYSQLTRCQEKLAVLLRKKQEYYDQYNKLKESLTSPKFAKGKTSVAAEISKRFNVEVLNTLNKAAEQNNKFFLYSQSLESKLSEWEKELDRLDLKLNEFLKLVAEKNGKIVEVPTSAPRQSRNQVRRARRDKNDKRSQLTSDEEKQLTSPSPSDTSDEQQQLTNGISPLTSPSTSPNVAPMDFSKLTIFIPEYSEVTATAINSGPTKKERRLARQKLKEFEVGITEQEALQLKEEQRLKEIEELLRAEEERIREAARNEARKQKKLERQRRKALEAARIAEEQQKAAAEQAAIQQALDAARIAEEELQKETERLEKVAKAEALKQVFASEKFIPLPKRVFYMFNSVPLFNPNLDMSDPNIEKQERLDIVSRLGFFAFCSRDPIFKPEVTHQNSRAKAKEVPKVDHSNSCVTAEEVSDSLFSARFC